MADGYEFKFRCRCGEHTATARYRLRGEDIAAYLEKVIRPAMYGAHMRLSPLCMVQSADLLLPINEAAQAIGMRTEH